jgi:hypothetical protein
MKPIRLEILCHAPPGFRKTARLPEIAADILNNHPAWQALGLLNTRVHMMDPHVASSAFAPTHIVILHSGERVPVRALGDWVADEEDGTTWTMNMDVLAPWWVCPKRNVRSVARVEELGR